MRSTTRGLSFVALMGALAVAAPAGAQTEISARSFKVTVGGRLHVQGAHSSVEDAKAMDFFVRRARLEVDVAMNDFLDGRLQPAFVIGKVLLQDAYLRLKFDPAFRVSFGQFKRGFDPFELTSSTEIIPIERTGVVPGFGVTGGTQSSACAGVGRMCSLSLFTEKLQYSGRDTGVRVDGSFGGKWSYVATLTNGTGITENLDENGTKSLAGRIEYSPRETVTLGANVSVHDHPNEVTEEDDYGVAWGGDIQLGGFRQGPLLRFALIGGDNWQALDDEGGPATFVTAQGIASYYRTIESTARLAGIEPLLRVSWGDGDTAADDDGGLLVTPGVNLYLVGRNRIQLNVDWYSPQGEGGSEYSLKVQTSLYF